MSERFGEPVELPWWVVPAGLPPLVTLLLAPFVHAPAGARLLVAAFSMGMLWVVLRVARRVRSASMQSVWISGAYAFWFFVVVLWVAEAAQG